MKKAVVVGGSSGIGLAISKKLMDENYKTIIVDKTEPDTAAIGDYSNFDYISTNLVYFDRDLLPSSRISMSMNHQRY